MINPGAEKHKKKNICARASAFTFLNRALIIFAHFLRPQAQKTQVAWASSIFVSATRIQKYDQPGYPLQSFGCAKRISASIPCAPRADCGP
jgi:hypothetical protein